MKYALALLLLLPAASAHAARGSRCEADDKVMLYHSTGRFADWGERQVRQKCQELSERPELCHFRGCRAEEIPDALARSADRERARLARETKQVLARATRPAANSGAAANARARATAEARRRAYESIDAAIQRPWGFWDKLRGHR